MSKRLKVEVGPNAEQIERLIERVKLLSGYLEAAAIIARDIELKNIEVKIEMVEE